MDDQTKHFTIAFRRILILVQLLKINIEDYKQLSIHKEIKPAKNQTTLKSDAAELFNALNAYILKSKARTNDKTWTTIHLDMAKEQVKDINCILDILVQIKDTYPIYEELLELVKRDNPGEDIFGIEEVASI